jgi:hypothetical protein
MEVFMTTVTTPDWLNKHGGQLQGNAQGTACFVFLGSEPQYIVEAIPAGGQYACRVKQTVNGKRLESANLYSTPELAMAGGLEDLRKALGW